LSVGFGALLQQFLVNGGSLTPVNEVFSMLDARAEKLGVFQYDVKVAWDVQIGGGKRVVRQCDF
jgi:hypothetical protein